MSRWIAGAAVVLSLLATSGASAAPDRTFQQVASGAPAYTLVQQLETQGFFTGYPEWTFNGKRTLRRYDFAVATERIYRAVQPRVAAADRPGQLTTAVRDLRALLEEYRSEIQTLGYDVEEMSRQINEMDERLLRLGASRAPETSDVLAAAFSRPRVYGLRPALRKPLFTQTLTGDPITRAATIQPSTSIAGDVGGAHLTLGVNGPDSLHTDARLPFQDPMELLDLHAQLSLPFGSYTLSAFYSRAAGMWDHYGLTDAGLAAGPVEEVGGAITRSLTDRLELQLATATINSVDDDLTRMVYWKGALHYRLGSGFFLGLGYERSRQLGIAGMGLDNAAYILRIDRSLGKNTRLGLQIRQPDTGNSAAGGSGVDNASAITQINVRF